MARPETTDFDKEILKQVSINLYRLIRQKGWTKKRLAEESKIKPSTLSGYFGEKYNISPGNLQKLADTLGVTKGDIDPRYNIDGKQIMNLLNCIYNIEPIEFPVGDNTKPDFKEYWFYDHIDPSATIVNNKDAEAIKNVIKNRHNIDIVPIKINSSTILDIDIDLLRVEAKHSQKALTNYINCANELVNIISKFAQREKIQLLSSQIIESLTTANAIKKEYEELYKSHGLSAQLEQPQGNTTDNINI